MKQQKSVYLLDAYALIYRSYYAFIRTPRINSKGMNTSAAFGFVNIFLDILAKQKAEYVAVAFDTHAPTFRHEMYTDYKANRDAQPEDISIAVPYIRRFLEALNIKTVELPGYEADDIIGTLANKLSAVADSVYMVTPDKDYAQLVRDNIRMIRPQTQNEAWGTAEICEHFGISDPRQVIDLLGLWGDASDNIPGCPGVGEKRAKELLAAYGSIEGIYEHIDELKGKVKENLINAKEQVLLSQKLATIATDAPIELSLDDTQLKEPDRQALQQLFAELEFKNLMPRINAIFSKNEPALGGLFEMAQTQETEAEACEMQTAATTPHEYQLVQTDDEISALAAQLEHATEFCFDTETTGVNAMAADIVGLSVATEPHKAYYIPFGTDYDECKRRLSLLANVFANPAVGKIGQNMKYDILILSHYGISLAGPMFDTMIAHAVLYPGGKHGMDYMSETMLGYTPIHIEELIGKGAKQISMREVDIERVKEYAAEDADITLQLCHALRPMLEENTKLYDLFRNIEMPLMPVLAEMERHGVKLDTEAMDNYSNILREQIIASEQKVKELAGCDFNLSSPKQVGDVLFGQLKIDPSARKTRTGQYATSEDVLQKLSGAHPIVAEILNYRGLVKLLSTYAEALPRLVNPRTNRIHTSFNQTAVVTGRLSSSDPNLQNIPIREANGREIRKAFVAADADHMIIAADYSQVELRLMAHFSNDAHMIEAFRNGEDIHAATAAKIFKVPLSEVTSDMRRKAKTANFGIIYGITAFGLAERLGIPQKEAKEIIEEYFGSFPGVKAYMNRCIEEAKSSGSVTTLFGRHRKLDDINSRNSVVRNVAERNAINAPIQGTAADIIKIAMINIDKALRSNGLKTKMILQVHDELVFDTLRSEADEVKRIVKECMEQACQLSVPLTAEIGEGNNWLEAH